MIVRTVLAIVPASIGRLVVTGDRVRFEPAAGAPVTLKDRPITAPIDLKSDEKGEADQIAVAGIALWVHMSGDRRTIRIRDVNGAPARAFEGFTCFPIDPTFRVTGRFIKDAAPRQVRIPNQLGDEETYTTEGIVELALDGRTITMRPMTTRPGRLYFIFRDGTSGKETYPPCSFNPYTTCPLPLKENRLTARILAGEKAYPHPPHSNQ